MRLEDEPAQRGSVLESVIHSPKRRFGDALRARTWFRQFRELPIDAPVTTIGAELNS